MHNVKMLRKICYAAKEQACLRFLHSVHIHEISLTIIFIIFEHDFH